MNKIPLLILLFLFGFQYVFGQEFAIENLQNNYAYPWISNYLRVVIKNENCENILIKTDNGTIKKPDSLECDFEFFPKNVGHATLSVCVIENSDTIKIGERKYRIKKWPEHKPYIGRISSEGKMPKAEFWAHGGVNVPIQYFDMTGLIPVVSYKITVARNGERVYDLANFGGRFEEDNYEILKDIRVGDKVFISEIMVKVPGESINTKLKDLRIEIIK